MAANMQNSSIFVSNVQQADSNVQAREEPRSHDSIQKDLDECLTNIQPSGSFSICDTLPNPINPGIYLANGGVIGLPLSDRDAEQLIAASHQAPFGKGEHTLVDTSVRKTWEISAADFELRNPAWVSFLRSIVTKVSTGLGVNASGKDVFAQLYKMLLYDEGSMFKAHQDSEKVPHMFGTLVVALPSEHKGGEVHVTHAGKTEILETSPTSKFDASYLAWFSDVTHSVSPVLSGRRLVLTYNLVHTTLGSRELAANTNIAIAKLRSILPQWKDCVLDGDLEESAAAYMLTHQYTEASLSYDGLKGYDQQIASHLRQVCDELDICLYLANVKRIVKGQCDGDERDHGEELDYIDEDSVEFTRVVDLNGIEVANDIATNQEWFIQDEPFKGMEPDDEENEYTGNEGTNSTLFYEKTVVLIIPRSRRIDYFFPKTKDNKIDHTKKMIAWTKQLVTELSQRPDDTQIDRELQVLLEGLTPKISKLRNLPERLAYLETLQLGLQGLDASAPVLQNYQSWLTTEVENCLTDGALSLRSAKDGIALANISKTISSQKMFTHILPIVKRNASNPAMTTSFLTALIDAVDVGSISSAVVDTIYKDIVAELSESFRLRHLKGDQSNKRVATSYSYYKPQSRASAEPDLESSHNIAAVLCQCYKYSLSEELETIITKMIEEANHVTVDFFERLYLPILQALTIRHTQGQVSPFDRLFQQLLAIYVIRYVGDEPQAPRDWARKPPSCSCNACQLIAPFVMDPVATSYHMMSLSTKFKHVQEVLGRDFSYVPKKKTTPQSGYWTKSLSGFNNDHRLWVERRDEAKKNIAKLGTDNHDLYLGQWKDAITNVWVPNLQQFVQSSRSNAGALAPMGFGAVDNVSNRTLPPITKRKVPNQVIVIDDSD